MVFKLTPALSISQALPCMTASPLVQNSCLHSLPLPKKKKKKKNNNNNPERLLIILNNIILSSKFSIVKSKKNEVSVKYGSTYLD